MPPSTALVSALSLPVANYSSAHLADLLAGREEGETRRARSLRDAKHPSHLPPAFMSPQAGGGRRKCVRATKGEKSERGDKEQKEKLDEKKKRNESRPEMER